MASLREIKLRIESVRNTRQITNAMKMVAAANLRRAQERIINARPYARHLDQMLRTVQYKNPAAVNPFLSDEREEGKIALVIVTSDRGLCGAFNHNVTRFAQSYIEKHPEVEILCVGRKGYDHMKKKVRIDHKWINYFNEMDFSVSREIGRFLSERFLGGEYRRVDVLYNEFKSAIKQDIVVQKFLPIAPLKDTEGIPLVDYIYEPDENTIINELGRKYTDVEFWRIMLESSAAEQAARRMAMESATDNATDMIEKLTLTFNRARQATITKEIIEIASGAEAIKS